jgi:hypothetical protein
MAKMGRPLVADVARPNCPRGHQGAIHLIGRRLSKNGVFGKTRYRCAPTDRNEKRHDFLAPMSARRAAHQHAGAECPSCERAFGRAEGLATGWRYGFAVREVAEALVRAGRGDSYREVSADLRTANKRQRVRGKHPAKWAPRGPQLVIDYLDAFGPLVTAETAPKPGPPSSPSTPSLLWFPTTRRAAGRVLDRVLQGADLADFLDHYRHTVHG